MEKDKLTAIVVDDEQEAVDYLCDLLDDYKEIHLLSYFTDSPKAITDINNLKPDILFLDVQMPEKTGFDVVKSIRSKEYEPHIIFTTGFEKYAIRAIKYAAFDYLLKPVNAFELENVIERISNLKTPKPQQFDRLFDKLNSSQALKFNTATGFIVIHPDEIIYLEASRNYCELYLRNDQKELVTNNMKQVSKLLPEGQFFRISRSNIINLSFLKKVERKNHQCTLMVDGEKIFLDASLKYLKMLEKEYK
jgi:two-component system, LytTR family, response regulator